MLSQHSTTELLASFDAKKNYKAFKYFRPIYIILRERRIVEIQLQIIHLLTGSVPRITVASSFSKLT